MKVEVVLDAACTEPELTLRTAAVTSEVEQLLPETSVCLDTAFCLGQITPNGDGYYGPRDLDLMTGEQFLSLVERFGAGRILFGTDSPWSGQAESLAQIRALPLSPADQAAILGGNAQKLLGL